MPKVIYSTNKDRVVFIPKSESDVGYHQIIAEQVVGTSAMGEVVWGRYFERKPYLVDLLQRAVISVFSKDSSHDLPRALFTKDDIRVVELNSVYGSGAATALKIESISEYDAMGDPCWQDLSNTNTIICILRECLIAKLTDDKEFSSSKTTSQESASWDDFVRVEAKIDLGYNLLECDGDETVYLRDILLNECSISKFDVNELAALDLDLVKTGKCAVLEEQKYVDLANKYLAFYLSSPDAAQDSWNKYKDTLLSLKQK